MMFIQSVSVMCMLAKATAFTTKNFNRPLSVMKSTSSLSMSANGPSGGKLTELCQISKLACDAVAPMLQAFYDKIKTGDAKDTATKLKSDATYFSIADGIVQHMFIEYLFKGNKFGQIVGEEDGTAVNIKVAPYTVDDLEVPSEFNNLIYGTLATIKMLASKIDPIAYKDITIFVDPIDGTREFATGQGDKVTILIGYNDKNGVPAAGIMYRPLTVPVTWAAGAKSEGCAIGVLNCEYPPRSKGILVTDGKVSPFLAKAIDELGFEKIPSLASGNRAMMMLEGKAGAYIRDTGGFAKWDTSGPQAVVEAFGGTMSKLPAFLKDKTLESYTHLKAEHNLDFEPDVTLTLTNARDKKMFKKDEVKIIEDVTQLKEYACLRGLVALDRTNMQNIDSIHAALKKVEAEIAPLYT
jgi:3'-phosphoadenosine 5'-phosphosulfate (PAPS) 3'-phosphatase